VSKRRDYTRLISPSGVADITGMRLETLDAWFRSFLHLHEFDSIDPSMNGLQVGRRNREVQRVAFAVDACVETFHRATVWNADILVVHHGIFWGREQAVRDAHYARLRHLIERDLGLYAVHLPLDQHMVYGNNAQMALALELEEIQPFGSFRGKNIGCMGSFATPVSLDSVVTRLFGSSDAPLAVLPFGATQIRTVGMVSGGGGSSLDEAVEKSLDLFITGDASHTLYHRALESAISVVFGGHYLTEIWGVKALAEKLSREYPDVETTFIDVPTGL